MLKDDEALAFIKFATAQEDRVFEGLLSMVKPVPVPDTEPTGYDPGFSACASAVVFLLLQEEKMERFEDWPQSVKDHEKARTEKMRKALQDKFGQYFDAWYTKAKKDRPDRA